MAYSFRRVASDNGKSNQLQSCKILPKGVNDRISKIDTLVPKLLRHSNSMIQKLLFLQTGSHWKTYLKENATIPLSLKGLYHSQKGCTTAARNSSDDSAMQGMQCFTPKVPHFDLQERIFLSVVFRIWFFWVAFPLIPQNYPSRYHPWFISFLLGSLQFLPSFLLVIQILPHSHKKNLPFSPDIQPCKNWKVMKWRRDSHLKRTAKCFAGKKKTFLG